MIIRPIIAGIFWYDSHDFQKIIKEDTTVNHNARNNGEDLGAGGMTDDEKIFQKAMSGQYNLM